MMRLACMVWLLLGAMPLSAEGARREPARRAAAPNPARILDDVRIEGDVPMPQVLFVTARQQRHVLMPSHRRYLDNSSTAAVRVRPMTWTHVAGPRPLEDRKESNP